MNKKITLAVLLSGAGTNLQAIVDCINKEKLQADIKIVISNNENAFGLERAKENGLKSLYIGHQSFKDREAYDQKLVQVISKENVDFIVLAGFMRILGSNFVKSFPNKIINIHPSLLPKYPGLNTHKKVLDNKDKEHGVTVHLVDEGLDSGPIIGFMKLEVGKDANESELKNRIHKLEHFIYPKILSDLQKGRVVIDDNKIKIDEVFYKNGKEYFN